MAITTSRRASHPLRGLTAAIQFLTRTPISTPADGAFDLAAAAAWFPLVGAAIGLTTGGVIWLAAHVWPAWPAVVLGLICEALLTGALHEDALADACDGFGGGWTREDVLRIFEDSRVGSYGVLGLCLAVLLRAGLFASLTPSHVIAAAMASATLGRWAMLPAMAALAPVAGRSSLAEQPHRKLGGRQVLVGSLLALPGVLPMARLMPVQLVCAGTVLLLLVPIAAAYFRRRLGGLTGDCLGTLCYLAQLGVLACAAAGWAP